MTLSASLAIKSSYFSLYIFLFQSVCTLFLLYNIICFMDAVSFFFLKQNVMGFFLMFLLFFELSLFLLNYSFYNTFYAGGLFKSVRICSYFRMKHVKMLIGSSVCAGLVDWQVSLWEYHVISQLFPWTLPHVGI